MTTLAGSHTVVALDPLFDEGPEAMVELAHRYGTYRTYGSHEKIDHPLGRGLQQRHDSILYFLRTGGLRATTEPASVLAARTAYFRQEYAYLWPQHRRDRTSVLSSPGGSDEPGRPGPLVSAPSSPTGRSGPGGRTEHIAGIGSFLHSERLADAARQVHGRPVVEPAIAYANLMVPGQELAVHTDVPEFRGADRKRLPQWLLVVMHHSGLFEHWRLPIATGIAWFHDSDHGALAFWPDGPSRPVDHHRIRANTALVLDTDTVFHGVDRVTSDEATVVPPVSLDSTLAPVGGVGDPWVLHASDGTETARYDWDELRFSVSWKAYVFADEAERDAWRDGTDDLDEDAIVDRLVADLAERGVAAPDVSRDPDLGLLLIDTYVRFPD
ncbi:MAG TPA: hypothetical protein VGO60_05825 [Iamia sp.]|nr:hypothetical protein [Iamia sp.]